MPDFNTPFRNVGRYFAYYVIGNENDECLNWINKCYPTGKILMHYGDGWWFGSCTSGALWHLNWCVWLVFLTTTNTITGCTFRKWNRQTVARTDGRIRRRGIHQVAYKRLKLFNWKINKAQHRHHVIHQQLTLISFFLDKSNKSINFLFYMHHDATIKIGQKNKINVYALPSLLQLMHRHTRASMSNNPCKYTGYRTQ